MQYRVLQQKETTTSIRRAGATIPLHWYGARLANRFFCSEALYIWFNGLAAMAAWIMVGFIVINNVSWLLVPVIIISAIFLAEFGWSMYANQRKQWFTHQLLVNKYYALPRSARARLRPVMRTYWKFSNEEAISTKVEELLDDYLIMYPSDSKQGHALSDALELVNQEIVVAEEVIKINKEFGV